MASDENAADLQQIAPQQASPAPPRRRAITRLVFLIFGLVVAFYLAKQGPQEQHVRVVLGAAAPEVTGVSLQYVAKDGEVARESRLTFPKGSAPRIVAHEPQLPNGEYRLQIEVDERDVHRSIQRQVTLGGGSTQIDVSSALARDDNPSPEPGDRERGKVP